MMWMGTLWIYSGIDLAGCIMITDKLLDLVFKLIEGFLANIPAISFDIDSEVIDVALGVIDGILYFFPLDKILPIISLIVAIQSFRISIRLITTIISFIPF